MSSTIVPTRSAAADIVDTRKETGGVWPLRRTIAFVLVVCGAFWIALGAAIVYLMKAL